MVSLAGPFVIVACALIAIPIYLLWSISMFTFHKVKPKTTSLGEGEITVPLNLVGNKLVGQITVGTAKQGGKDQQFNVVFHTESGLVWLASVEACKNRDCRKEQFEGFDRPLSSSHSTQSKPFQSTIDSNNMKGIIVYDSFKFGLDGKKISIAAQGFAEITSFGGTLKGYDGMFGLSLVSEAEHEAAVWTILNQKTMSPIFGFFINSKEGYSRDDAMLVLGGNDKGLMKGQPNSHDVVKQGDAYVGWLVNIDKIIFERDGKREEYKLETRLATPSPGDETIALPEVDFRDYNKKLFQNSQIKLDAEFNFKCKEDRQHLPVVVIVMDGKEYKMRPKDYVTEMYYGEEDQCGSGFVNAGPGRAILLGRTFLRRFYTRFNIRTKQLQIAEARHVPVRSTVKLAMFSGHKTH